MVNEFAQRVVVKGVFLGQLRRALEGICAGRSYITVLLLHDFQYIDNFTNPSLDNALHNKVKLVGNAVFFLVLL